MTPSQRYFRNLARKATTRAKREIERSQIANFHSQENLAAHFALVAGSHARDAARYAFRAHPELRESEESK